jgi:ATP-dependent exoDNAse (exonuclease V) beta subunit
VGNAVHAFLAADLPELEGAQRRAVATRLLDAAELRALLAPEALVQAGDNLRNWVQGRWPDAVWHREISVAACIDSSAGARRVRGTIDLLLETPEGVVLIDHKSYPGASDTWAAKAAEFAPQFAAYAEALRMAGYSVREQWVNFAVGGGVVRMG